MTFMTSIGLIFVALVFLVGEMYRDHKKNKRLDRFLIDKEERKVKTKFNSFLVKFGKEHRKDLEQKLQNAGYYNKDFAKYYFPMKIAIIVVAFFLIMLMDTTQGNKVAYFVLAVVGAIIVPDAVLALRKKWVVRKISRNLPYLLDMMSVCVQTGMTIEASFAYLAKELQTFDADLCYQIKKTSESGKVHGIEKALHDLSERLPAPEVSSFVLTIIQNIHYGTSVANILSDLAEDMRRIQLLTIEEKMGKLSAKMSVPLILLIMFPIVILILAPGIMQLEWNVGGS